MKRLLNIPLISILFMLPLSLFGFQGLNELEEEYLEFEAIYKALSEMYEEIECSLYEDGCAYQIIFKHGFKEIHGEMKVMLFIKAGEDFISYDFAESFKSGLYAYFIENKAMSLVGNLVFEFLREGTGGREFNKLNSRYFEIYQKWTQ